MFTEALTMEEIFLLTYAVATILGVVFGFLAYWIFEKETAKEDV